MSYFTLQVTAAGPILSAYITVSEARAAALTEAGQPIPQPVLIRALVDTGASCTCVDPSVLATLNLTPTGSVSINTPSTGTTPHLADEYDVGLTIPDGASPLFLQTIPVVASELLTSHGFHALIGRDILEHCLLVYNGKESFFSLAF